MESEAGSDFTFTISWKNSTARASGIWIARPVCFICSLVQNEIHHAPHCAIIFNGNNHVIERNHIYDVCREADDAAAIHVARSWTARGTVIRHYLFRKIAGYKKGTHRVSGVYLNDGFSGTDVDGNIPPNVAQSLLFSGGRANTAENNIFINNENMMRGPLHDLTALLHTMRSSNLSTERGIGYASGASLKHSPSNLKLRNSGQLRVGNPAPSP
jgi:hypothetical protein